MGVYKPALAAPVEPSHRALVPTRRAPLCQDTFPTPPTIHAMSSSRRVSSGVKAFAPASTTYTVVFLSTRFNLLAAGSHAISLSLYPMRPWGLCRMRQGCSALVNLENSCMWYPMHSRTSFDIRARGLELVCSCLASWKFHSHLLHIPHFIKS